VEGEALHDPPSRSGSGGTQRIPGRPVGRESE
jgi:hypothetical protein